VYGAGRRRVKARFPRTWVSAARPGKTAGRKFRKRRACHYGLSGALLWRIFDWSKALPRQASLRVVFVGHPGFVGFSGWEVVAWRDVDLEASGFVAGELLVDRGEGAQEQAGDVGEAGGAASGDVAADEEPKEMGEGMVDALGGLEVFGAHGEQVSEVLGVGGWRFGVAGTELGLRVLDEARALVAGRGVVLATFGRAGGFGVSFGVRVRCFHERSFLGSNFISKKFNLRGGYTPLFFEKRLEDIENK
jgi:hypothetical protein